MTSNSDKRPFIIGLTGGIGSGKSTVADNFSALGVPVIDTDEIAKTLVMPGTEALELIISHFGQTILEQDGSLNRRKLRQIVFSTPLEKSWLEKILHPRIQQEVTHRLTTLKDDFVIVMIPLLFEYEGYHQLLNRTLVIDVAEETQIERSSKRDSISKEDIEKVMASQVSREERLKKADDILENNLTKKELTLKVRSLYDFYRNEASKYKKCQLPEL